MGNDKMSGWRSVDNAGKLYSASSTNEETRVFRIYCQLKEEVDKDILQLALDKTLEKYPVFLTVMRKGFFWHYLERSNIRPVVQEEYREPCSNLYIRDKRKLLFEVTYYNTRINFEVFHALTDGTGAIEFIKELVKNYLYLKYGDELPPREEEEYISPSEMEVDGFAKFYSKDVRAPKKKAVIAHQIPKKRIRKGSIQITEMEMSTSELAKKAKSHGASMTSYLAAVFIRAINKNMTRRQEAKPVVLMIPVNLRKMFPCKTMLNFFSWIKPKYYFTPENEDLDSIIKSVKEFFAEELTPRKMQEQMNEYIAMEAHPILRLVPLDIKNWFVKRGTKLNEVETTGIFSNMGIIDIAEQCRPYIERFGIFTSTPKIELCMCSFGDKVHLGFTSKYDSTAIKHHFRELLKSEGLETKILESEYSEDVKADTAGGQMFRRYTFACIILAVLGFCADYIYDQTFVLSLTAFAGIGTMWFLTYMAYAKRHNLLKSILWQLIVCSFGSVLWDYFIGWGGWSLEYAVPILSIISLVSMLVLRIIYKYEENEYVIYIILASVFGAVFSIVTILFGWVKMVIPAVISIGLSVITVAGMLLFKTSEMTEELEKKFHI